MRGRVRASERGQGAVEFALTMPVVFLIILGCLELGFAFHAYLTVISAAREGARAGAVYLYDGDYSAEANRSNRENGTGTDDPYVDNIRDTVERSLGVLKKTPPNFDKNSSVTISYSSSPLLTQKGDLLTVEVHYRHDFLTQLLGTSIDMEAKASARIE